LPRAYLREAKYTPAQRELAVDHFVANGRCLAVTIKALGFPSRSLLAGWIRDAYPHLRPRVGQAREALSSQANQSAVMALLRIPYMQQWLTLSDPAMEEALHDTPLFREFAGLGWDTWPPDESTILRFRHLLEKHKLAEQILALVNELLRDKGLLLKAGTVVDATSTWS
jgi:Transposase domain (DUF772)